ncbi:FHA domain-containing protein [Myxococcota bacterium]|nr:FHA domain-containing protein [Myxococcota bacterium]MBU1432746.1 FHA domain-containing protein [Myxococcota bacterium]MBU1896911.1 FHA domain-containing protein [Myxococcota bacterium]
MTAMVICPKCGADVPVAHKFCGKCGQAMQGAQRAAESKTAFFADPPKVGRARLALVRGEGMEEIGYRLNAVEHVAGRKTGALLFAEDNFMSPRHATFFYEGERLFVRDEEALNGVFIRIRKPTRLASGDSFLAGEELLVVHLGNPEGAMFDAQRTHFFASPRPTAYGRVSQILEGGQQGLQYLAPSETVSIGREASDICFPTDRFISGRHCRLTFEPSQVVLTDLGSRNGTFVQIKGTHALEHGDFLFVGKQLLRVEMTDQP